MSSSQVSHDAAAEASGPDGDRWLSQQVTERLPGRV